MLHKPLCLSTVEGVLVEPTVREADGLALSSRNKYLVAQERTQATVLSAAIQRARRLVRQARKPVPVRKLQAGLRRFIQAQPAARIDYISFFHPETLRPETTVKRGTHLALAVFIGTTRLIDNDTL